MIMATIYRSKITSEYRTQNLLNFYNSISDTEDGNTIYLMFGRSENWADNEQDINFAPPYPDDSVDGQADVWSRALGLVKIPQANLKAVLPRQDWGDPNVENALQFYIGDVVVTNTNSNNKHPSALAGYMVYRCIDVPDTGNCSLDDSETTYTKDQCIGLGGKWSATSSTGVQVNIPNGTGDAIDTQDGYFWEYLYTIPPSEVINNVTSDYIIVPFPDDIINDPTGWGLSNEITYDNKINELIYSIGVNTLRFRSRLTGGDYFANLAIIGNSGYRQISIVLNPLLYRASTVEPAVKATGDTYLPSAIEQTSGNIIYMENRQPIFKATDQVEEFNLLFRF